MAMQTDGLSKRSVPLRHRNTRSLHFRAYAVGLDDRLAHWKDYSLVPEGDELRKLVRSKEMAAPWTVALPATPDFSDHTTYVAPEASPHLSQMIA